MSDNEKKNVADEVPNAGSSDPLIGSDFVGKYHVLKQLGRGGMGAVYLAEHKLMKRKVAIKILLSAALNDESALKRFEHEAQVASKLSHPNAVTLHDFGVEGDMPYLVMEYVEGRTLKQLLASSAPLALSQVVRLLEEIGGALSQAHRLGIVHRDLKPENIILAVTEDGSEQAKVLDFGISKLLHSEGSAEQTDLTTTGMVMGTPKYLSPEQAKGEEIDGRADLYSLGVMTYEMLSAEAPFEGGSVLEIIAKRLHTEAPLLNETTLGANTPLAVSRVVAAALEREPSKRPQSVDEFVSNMRDAAFAGGVQAARPSRKRLFLPLGLVLALAVGGLMWFVQGRKPQMAMVSMPAATETMEEGSEPVSEPSSVVEIPNSEKPTVVPDKNIEAEAEENAANEPDDVVETAAEVITEPELEAPVVEPPSVSESEVLVPQEPEQKLAVEPVVEKREPEQSVVPGFYIESAKLWSKAEAEALIEKFKQNGYLTLLETIERERGTQYIVFAGRFESMYEAMVDAKKVAAISGIKRPVTVVKQKP